MSQFFGKYRGKVANNIDPLQVGRVQVSVPAVLGDGSLSWAMPCVPYGGQGVGFYAVPPVGANIWVEFEGGDTDFPIWSGCFWGLASEVPSQALVTPTTIQHIVIQTLQQNSLIVSDAPGPVGGIQIKTTSGAMILVNDTGITISNGKGATISMTGPTVDINAGAMTIT